MPDFIIDENVVKLCLLGSLGLSVFNSSRHERTKIKAKRMEMKTEVTKLIVWMIIIMK